MVEARKDDLIHPEPCDDSCMHVEQKKVYPAAKPPPTKLLPDKSPAAKPPQTKLLLDKPPAPKDLAPKSSPKNK